MSNTLLYNSFNWGISDDKFTWFKNSYQSWKAIEVRKNPQSLTLANLTEKISWDTVTTRINKIIQLNSTWKIIYFWTAWKIYYSVLWWTWWANCYTDTGWKEITDAIEYNWYVYWSTITHIDRIAIADVDADWSWDVTENYQAFSDWTTWSNPMIEINWKLYIWDGRNLAEFDWTTWNNSIITLDYWQKIDFLTLAWSTLRIYCNRDTTSWPDTGRCYFWDTISDNYNESIEWPWDALNTITSLNWIDYVVSWEYLYSISWYNKIKLKKLPEQAEVQWRHGSCIFNWLILLCWTYWARTYWSLNKNYSDVLNFDFPTSSNYAETWTAKTYTVFKTKTFLLIAWQSWATYWVDKINVNKYSTTWQVISRVYDAWSWHMLKRIIRSYISTLPIATGESVVTSYSLDNSWSFTTDLTINTVAQLYKENFPSINEYNYIETKVILTAWTSNNTTPELKEYWYDFDIVNQN